MISGEIPAPESRAFNPFEALVGVITRPAATMARIAAARPWQIALALTVAIALISGLVNLTNPAPAGLGADPNALGADVPSGMVAALNFIRSPLFALVAAVLSPVLLLFLTGIYFLLGRLFGGTGSFSALFSTLAFASVPNLLFAPLSALLNLGGLSLGINLLRILLNFAFSIWVLVLQVLGVRESLHLSTGRAIGTVLVPIALLFLILCALVLVFFALLARAFSSAP
jgi:hypothetical protein